MHSPLVKSNMYIEDGHEFGDPGRETAMSSHQNLEQQKPRSPTSFYTADSSMNSFTRQLENPIKWARDPKKAEGYFLLNFILLSDWKPGYRLYHPINPAKRISLKKVPATTFTRTQLDYIWGGNLIKKYISRRPSSL